MATSGGQSVRWNGRQWRQFLSLSLVLSLATTFAPTGRETAAAPSVSPWATWDTCRDLFAYYVYRYDRPHLSPEEKRIWTDWLDPNGESLAIYTARLTPDLMWDIYSRIPGLIRDRIEKLPSGITARRRYLDDLGRELGLQYLPRSFVETLVEEYANDWTIGRQRGQPFADWARDGLHRREALLNDDPRLGERWRAQHLSLLVELKAHAYWDRAFEVAIPFETFGKDQIRVRVGTHQYSGVVRGQEVYLKVPATVMAHPAWNPLSEKHLMTMAQEAVRPPDAWYASLGHDGLFYMQDGNHRFALSGKKEVWVRISFPPQTSTLRIYLDHWGVNQPSPEMIQKLYRKQIGFWDVLPEHARRRMILLPAGVTPR